MKRLSLFAAAISAIALTGCVSATSVDAGDTPASAEASVNATKLAATLAAQPDEVRARYVHRHPAQTLAFFGVEPGDTVAEALPGGGWYTKILLPYVGPEGKVVGAHYPDDLWAGFGWDAERVQGRIDASNNWTTTAAEWGVANGAAISDYKITGAAASLNGTVDTVLYIRALHNLNRFDYTDKAVAETYRILKPGGTVGVVQHRAPEGNSDEWADGSSGYMKQSAVIAAFEKAGFVLEETSEINANPKDKPTTEDIVWRLPPSLATTEDDTPEQAALKAIGESDRMTLRFRKPA